MIPDFVEALFWNVRPGLLDPDRHASTIIPTVLIHGRTDQVRWLFRQYGRARLREVVIADALGLQTLPVGELRFWMQLLAPDVGYDVPTDIVSRWRPRRSVQ